MRAGFEEHDRVRGLSLSQFTRKRKASASTPDDGKVKTLGRNQSSLVNVDVRSAHDVDESGADEAS